METNREKVIFEIYSAAFAMAPTERAGFLDHQCGSQPEIRQKVEELLELAEHHESRDSFGQRLCRMVERQLADLSEESGQGPSLEPGSFFHHFHILDKLGEGGMGVVYRALDTRLKRLVAIKIASRHRMQAPEADKRLLMEALAVGRLSHPNVVTLYSVEETEREIFLIMEYLEGKTLQELLDGQAWDVKRFLDVARQIAGGMAAVHRQGLVHRDLKPGNIMIMPNGRAKVLDFGLAKLYETGKRESMAETLCQTSQPHMFRGTLPYMAPEQLRGEAVSPATDVFALGVMFFEILTGKRPFSGENPADLVAAILKEPAPSLNGRGSKFSRQLRRLVARCLQKDAKARYRHAGEVDEALGNMTFLSRSKLLHAGLWALGGPLLLWVISANFLPFHQGMFRLFSEAHSVVARSEAVPSEAPCPNLLPLPAVLGTLQTVQIDHGPPWLESMVRQLVYYGMNQSRHVRLVSPTGGATPGFRLSVVGSYHGSAGYELKLEVWDGRGKLEGEYPVTGESVDLLPSLLNQSLQQAMAGFDSAFYPRAWNPSGLSDKASLVPFFNGVAHFEKGQEAEALSLFQQAQDLSPGFGWAMYRHSLTLSALAKKADAWGLAGLLVESDSWNEMERATFLGHFYMLSLDYRHARDAFKKAELSGYHSGELLRQLVHCDSEIGDLSQAVCRARRALSLDPGDVHNYSQLCFALVEANQFDLALREAKKAESLFAENGAVLWAKALALLGKGEPAGALEHIARLEAAYPDKPFYRSIVTRLRATEAMLRGDWTAAIEPLEAGLVLHSVEGLADLQGHNYLWLARLYWLLGNREEAMKYLDELHPQELKPIPPHLRALRRSALLYAEMGAWPQVAVLEERITRIAEDFPSGFTTSSRYMVNGVALLTRALDASGSARKELLNRAEDELRLARRYWVDVWLQWYLGRVYQAMGRPEAKAYFLDVVDERKGKLLYRAFPGFWPLANAALDRP